MELRWNCDGIMAATVWPPETLLVNKILRRCVLDATTLPDYIGQLCRNRQSIALSELLKKSNRRLPSDDRTLGSGHSAIMPCRFARRGHPARCRRHSHQSLRRIARIRRSGALCFGASERTVTVIYRPNRRLGAVLRPDLPQDGLDVNLHGRLRHVDLSGDHLVRASLDQAA
jgi:hypothetical protein